MKRVLILAGLTVAALAATDASAAGLFRKRARAHAAPTPVYAAPQSAAPCCGGSAAPAGVPTAVPGVSVPGTSMPAVPGTATPAAPAAPGGHHHSAAPSEVGAATTPVSAYLPGPADGLDAKEVKLEGTLVCAKCGLKEAGVKKCTNALQVKEGGKTVTYYLDDKGTGEDYHEGLCGGGTKEGATVTGVVTEKGGKKWVKPTKVEEKK